MRSLSTEGCQKLSGWRELSRVLLLFPLAFLVLPALLPASTARAAAPAPAWGTRGMVVSWQADAAAAGLEILRAGGNAVDAAVATAFAVGVTQPFFAGLGGGAFALVRRSNGEVSALDARETAPAAATRDRYVAPGAP